MRGLDLSCSIHIDREYLADEEGAAESTDVAAETEEA